MILKVFLLFSIFFFANKISDFFNIVFILTNILKEKHKNINAKLSRLSRLFIELFIFINPLAK
jgi:hypothetical protein